MANVQEQVDRRRNVPANAGGDSSNETSPRGSMRGPQHLNQPNEGAANDNEAIELAPIDNEAVELAPINQDAELGQDRVAEWQAQQAHFRQLNPGTAAPPPSLGSGGSLSIKNLWGRINHMISWNQLFTPLGIMKFILFCTHICAFVMYCKLPTVFEVNPTVYTIVPKGTDKQEAAQKIIDACLTVNPSEVIGVSSLIMGIITNGSLFLGYMFGDESIRSTFEIWNDSLMFILMTINSTVIMRTWSVAHGTLLNRVAYQAHGYSLGSACILLCMFYLVNLILNIHSYVRPSNLI